MFLLSAYEYLLNYHLDWYLKNSPSRHSDKIYEGVNNEWHLRVGEKQRILLNNIYGVDIDIQAVEVSRFSLLLKALEDSTNADIEALFANQRVKALPNLDRNIKSGNSLVDDLFYRYDPTALTSPELTGRLRPFNWPTEFPQIIGEGGFDVVLGNPPYIRIQNMVRYSPEEVQYYQSSISRYSTSQIDNFDKYSLFIERALSLLKPSGVLGYIVPNRFFATRAGQALRRLIAENQHLHALVDFGVQQVFGERVTIYSSILVLTKEASSQFTVELVGDLSAWRYGREGLADTYEAAYINEQPWEFLTPDARQLFNRLRSENASLDDVAEIFVGVQTSKDRVFIIVPNTITAREIEFVDLNGVSWTIEKAIVRPSIYDLAIKAFSKTPANSQIIFPYKIVDGRAILIPPNEMAADFPKCWAYLNAHKDRLLDRHIQNATPDTWYRYGRTQSLTKFDGQPKLVWPILSLEPRYSFDDQNIVFTGGGNGPYYALRLRPEQDISIFYIQAVLSHPIIEAMVRSRATKFRGGYASHGKQFIQHLPIKEIDSSSKVEESAYVEIVRLTQEAISLQESHAQSRTPDEANIVIRRITALRDRLNKLVDRLYGISANDITAYNGLINYWKGGS